MAAVVDESKEMMRELSELYTILKGILQNDNAARKKAESDIKPWLECLPKLLFCLAKLIHTSAEDYIRKLASVLFKQFVGLKGAAQSWEKLVPAQQQQIQAELLLALREERDASVAKQVCQAIAGLAGMIFSCQKDWPDLDTTITDFMRGNEAGQELAFTILETLFASSSDRYIDNLPLLFSLLDTGLKSGSVPVLLAATRATCAIIGEVDSSTVKPLYKYAPEIVRVLNIAHERASETELQRLIDVVSEVAECEPTFFRNVFPQLCEVMLKMSAKKSYANDKLRQIPLDILVVILQKLPKLSKKHKTLLWTICSAVFDIMISIDEEVDEEWLRPKEGFNNEEEMDPDENVNFGLTSYDRLLESLDEEDMFPIMEKVLETGLGSTDWKSRHAGLMAIAQVGEYVMEPAKVANVVKILAEQMKHPHPKVRYAALYAAGLMAEDMSPDFQNEFGKVLLPPLMSAVDDSVPHVQSHACAALTNFLEYVNADVSAEVAPVLLPKLAKLVREGISLVKENAMTCISSIAESSGVKFLPYYNEAFTFVLACIQESKTKEYSKLRGQGIECLTIMAAAVGKTNFLAQAPLMINMLKGVQEVELAKEDPQRCYLLGAWQRICLVLGKDLAPFLPEIMPKLMAIAGSTPGMGIGDSETVSLERALAELGGTKSRPLELTTTEVEEKEVALEVLAVFAAQLEETFAPYADQSAGIIYPTLSFQANPELRRSAAMILPSILKCISGAGNREVTELKGRAFLAELIRVHEDELRADIKGSQVIAMKKIIDILGHFMKPEEVNGMFKNIFSYFKDSSNRRTVLLNTKEKLEEDEGEDEEPDECGCDNTYEDNAESEEIYQKNVTYLLGAVVKSHKDESLPHIPLVVEQIVKPNLTGNVNQKRNAIFVIDDLIDFLGAEKLGPMLWKWLAESVASCAVSPEHELRQASCYGIGCLAKTGGAAFQEIAVNCLRLLAAALEIKEDRKKKICWAGARDCAVAAIGKILTYQGNTIPFEEVWGRWLTFLPVKEDESEAKDVVDFVTDCVIKRPDVAIGPNGAHLPDLIRIFVSVYPTTLHFSEYISMARLSLTKYRFSQ